MMINNFEVISIDIPNIIFEESKKFQLIYPTKNQFNLQPGTIVYFANFLDTVGVFVRHNDYYYTFSHLMQNGKIGIATIKNEDMYKYVKICSRQSCQPFDSLDKFLLNEIHNIFEKNINLIKCRCSKYSYKFVKKEPASIICEECGNKKTLSTLIYDFENKISLENYR